jgi:hypothetical protein
VSSAEAERPSSSDSNGYTLNSLALPYSLERNSSFIGHPPEGTPMMFETEIFIPSYHYEETGVEILVSDGDWRYVKERQTLYYRHKETEPGFVHSVMIKPVNHLSNRKLTGLSNSSNTSLSKQKTSDQFNRAKMANPEPSKLKSEGTYGTRSDPIKPEGETGCICAIM